eukprot:CAMPEP_0175580272 /NCGR_PEP_ID=MMETSP0096-20121207/47021_1 /TAXON_ID=311494 /ORGANISM="Alexandrium monilatum, Strain CCMP3105" /LENGTH=208 /DNA_ID=CAMNT_0016883879 /DNA_START=108 /DNA_END=731 /DNA_ORIENTATION=+
MGRASDLRPDGSCTSAKPRSGFGSHPVELGPLGRVGPEVLLLLLLRRGGLGDEPLEVNPPFILGCPLAHKPVRAKPHLWDGQEAIRILVQAASHGLPALLHGLHVSRCPELLAVGGIGQSTAVAPRGLEAPAAGSTCGLLLLFLDEDSSSLSVEWREPSEDLPGVEPTVVFKSDSSELAFVTTMDNPLLLVEERRRRALLAPSAASAA